MLSLVFVLLLLTPTLIGAFYPQRKEPVPVRAERRERHSGRSK